jgi:hypothetical protein
MFQAKKPAVVHNQQMACVFGRYLLCAGDMNCFTADSQKPLAVPTV